MATVKPVAFPRWNTGAANRTEPTSGKKDTGWVIDEQPASSFFNWLLHFGGLYDEWLSERLFDGVKGGGGGAEDLLITAPIAAAGGGTVTLLGADGFGAGDNGGPAIMIGGDATAGNALGGPASLAGGAGLGPSGEGTK